MKIQVGKDCIFRVKICVVFECPFIWHNSCYHKDERHLYTEFLGNQDAVEKPYHGNEK